MGSLGLIFREGWRAVPSHFKAPELCSGQPSARFSHRTWSRGADPRGEPGGHFARTRGTAQMSPF